MEFCPKCGAILVLKTKNYGCPQCSYTTNEKIKVRTSEKVEEIEEVAVVKDHDGETRPITDWDCPKCKSKKAYFWMRQMRSGDEPESRFFECVKCSHTVRED